MLYQLSYSRNIKKLLQPLSGDPATTPFAEGEGPQPYAGLVALSTGPYILCKYLINLPSLFKILGPGARHPNPVTEMNAHSLVKSMKFTLAITLGILLGMTLGPLPSTKAASQAEKPKKVGFMGNPAKKRGVEMGFDKGYIAGKADKGMGLEPDPKRHPEFNNPEKFHRSEFGSQAGFVSGFKGGFVGGYQKAFGKKVKISVPGLYQKPTDAEAGTAPKAPTQPDAASDAL